MRQNKALNYILQNEDQILNDANILTRSRRVDYEYYPIYIGTWRGQACYARHTIGDYLSDGHLITYGYASWYNTSGYNALPYRNGAANNGSGQGVVDVARYSSFAIRDLDTNIGYTLTVNDWGPDQYRHPDRIADLDKNIFRNMHGNTSAGLLYCRTWVALTNYNP